MPYIEYNRRKEIDEDLTYGEPETAGELNYVFSQFAAFYFRWHGMNYQAINDIIGALEGAKAEFQRRVVAPYEDTKIKANGDVYT